LGKSEEVKTILEKLVNTSKGISWNESHQVSISSFFLLFERHTFSLNYAYAPFRQLQKRTKGSGREERMFGYDQKNLLAS
jgi:hypothetical protein